MGDISHLLTGWRALASVLTRSPAQTWNVTISVGLGHTAVSWRVFSRGCCVGSMIVVMRDRDRRHGDPRGREDQRVREKQRGHMPREGFLLPADALLDSEGIRYASTFGICARG